MLEKKNGDRVEPRNCRFRWRRGQVDVAVLAGPMMLILAFKPSRLYYLTAESLRFAWRLSVRLILNIFSPYFMSLFHLLRRRQKERWTFRLRSQRQNKINKIITYTYMILHE